MILRRRRLPSELEPASAAFDRVLAELEPAKAALAEVMPTTRLPGRPLTDALSVFEEHLGRAAEGMSAWRRPEVDDVWRACDAGLADARERAERLRREAPELGGFEGLIWAVGELLEPLEVFEAAERRFRDLRV
ncbi:MAG: hypothetical protein U0V56_10150 [Actinomycetota bacterium]